MKYTPKNLLCQVPPILRLPRDFVPRNDYAGLPTRAMTDTQAEACDYQRYLFSEFLPLWKRGRQERFDCLEGGRIGREVQEGKAFNAISFDLLVIRNLTQKR